MDLEILWGQSLHNLSREPTDSFTVFMFLLLNWNSLVLIFFSFYLSSTYWNFIFPISPLTVILPIKTSITLASSSSIILNLLPWKPSLPNTCLPLSPNFFPAVPDYGVILPTLPHIQYISGAYYGIKLKIVKLFHTAKFWSVKHYMYLGGK